MKQASIVIALIAIIAFVIIAGTQIDFKGGQLSVYSGRLKVNLVQLKRIDGSAYGFADAQMRMIHGSGDYNDKVGTISSNAVTGDLKDADSGKWILVIDYATNNTCWLDHSETLNDPYITDVYGSDGDRDGFDEDYIEMNFADLPPLKGGEDKKEVEVTIVMNPARVSSIVIESLTNASSIGTSSYDYYTCTGYLSGFTEGDLAKLAMVELVFDDSGNTTYPDKQYQYWKMTHITIGPYTISSAMFGEYDLANTRFQYSIGDLNNHHGGKDLYYAKNSGDLWCAFEVKAYCNFPSASKLIEPTLNLYFYQPSGVLTSAVTHELSFES